MTENVNDNFHICGAAVTGAAPALVGFGLATSHRLQFGGRLLRVSAPERARLPETDRSNAQERTRGPASSPGWRTSSGRRQLATGCYVLGHNTAKPHCAEPAAVRCRRDRSAPPVFLSQLRLGHTCPPPTFRGRSFALRF